MEQFLRRQIASEKEEIERLRAEIAEIQRYSKAETCMVVSALRLSCKILRQQKCFFFFFF